MAFDLYKYLHENKMTIGKITNGFKHGQTVVVRPKDGKPFKAKVAKTQLSEHTVNLGENGTWDIKLVKALPKKKINESGLKKGSKVIVKHPLLVKPFKSVISTFLDGGKVVVLKDPDGVWDAKFVKLDERKIIKNPK